MKTLVHLSLGLLTLLLVAGCASPPQSPILRGNPTVYNKYNIHVAGSAGGELIASYANYTAPPEPHLIIEPGTPVKLDAYGEGFLIKQQNGQNVIFEYHPGRMQMSRAEYVNTIFSVEPVSLGKYSSRDREGIEQGKALKGMSKDGVMAALGYPAAHKTPTLSMDTWTYWTNRFGTIAVHFEDGEVVRVED